MKLRESIASGLVRLATKINGKELSPAPIHQHKSEKIELPHVQRAEVITSRKNGVHEFGKELKIEIIVSHTKPLRHGCLSINIVNKATHSISVHATAFPPEYIFGKDPGTTTLTCNFPSPKLNIGHYYIRTHLTETPGGEEYERLDGICHFEIIPPDGSTDSWDERSCAYREDFTIEWEAIHES